MGAKASKNAKDKARSPPPGQPRLQDEFRYMPLHQDRKEIRLVQAFAPDNAQIALRLRTVSLLDKPEYCALSYTWAAPFAGLSSEWDDPAETKTITVDNYPFQVRWNLEAALRAFCTSQGSGSIIWIDALCINQDDIPERNSQVRIMAEIYNSAVSTWIWLGPDSEDSDLAFKAIADITAAAGKRPKDHQMHFSFDSLPPESYRHWVDEELNPPDIVERLKAIEKLLSRNW